MPQRNERSICALYNPLRLSWMTLPNQPNSMYASSRAPTKKISGPPESARAALRSLNQVPRPTTVTSRPMLAMIGHLLCSGT
ncbi:hypothetical protein D3C80_2075140 [compost metagenome]